MVTADKIWWIADEMRLLARRGPRATRYPTADRSIQETVVVVATVMPQMGAVMMTPRALPTRSGQGGDGRRQGGDTPRKSRNDRGRHMPPELYTLVMASRRLHPLATF